MPLTSPPRPAIAATLNALTALLAIGAVGAAQAFPEGATTPTAAALKEHLNDRIFGTSLADGTSWRLEFKSSGYVFVDTSTGRNFKGEWKAEDGRVCTKMGLGADLSCSEARLHDGRLYVKRAATGELIHYLPK